MDDATERNRRRFSTTEIDWDALDKKKLFAIATPLYSGLTVVLHPVSLVKTILQVASHDSVEMNASSVVKGLLRREGIPGLYRGFGPAVIGSIPARTVFSVALERTKVSALKMVEPWRLSEPIEAAIINGVAGMVASFCSQVVYVPLDVISQKLMVQGYSGLETYSGGLDVARKIIKSEGIRGLYRGFGLSALTYSPSSAVWWASYGSSQRKIWRFHGSVTGRNVPSEGEIFLVQACAGIFAGATASCMTTPLDTIKTRFQLMGHEKKPTVKQVVRSLIADEGWTGFYRGLGLRFVSISAWGTSMIRISKALVCNR